MNGKNLEKEVIIFYDSNYLGIFVEVLRSTTNFQSVLLIPRPILETTTLRTYRYTKLLGALLLFEKQHISFL
jgi:hypothetical protein